MVGVLKFLQYRFPSTAQIQQLLSEVRFTAGPVLSLVSEVMSAPELWLNKEGPLNESWRKSDRSAIFITNISNCSIFTRRVKRLKLLLFYKLTQGQNYP